MHSTAEMAYDAAVALATGLGLVLVNALWTFVKWRMEKKEKAAERDIM